MKDYSSSDVSHISSPYNAQILQLHTQVMLPKSRFEANTAFFIRNIMDLAEVLQSMCYSITNFFFDLVLIHRSQVISGRKDPSKTKMTPNGSHTQMSA